MNISGDSIRVMTFNIRYDNEMDEGVHSWNNRKGFVTDLMRFHRPDIIGLQEVLKNQLDDIKEKLDGYEFYGVGREDGGEKGEYSPIFYAKDKFDCLDRGCFWLSEMPEKIGSVGWDAALPRIITWVKLKNRNTQQELFIFNGHFDHLGKIAVVKSAQLVLKKMNQLAGEHPALFLGDLNNTPMSEMYQVLIDGGLKDCISDSHYGSDFSLIGFDPVKLFYQHNDLGMDTLTEENAICKIDYIFYKNDISVLQYGILSDNLSGIYPSDHMPAVADIMVGI